MGIKRVTNTNYLASMEIVHVPSISNKLRTLHYVVYRARNFILFHHLLSQDTEKFGDVLQCLEIISYPRHFIHLMHKLKFDCVQTGTISFLRCSSFLSIICRFNVLNSLFVDIHKLPTVHCPLSTAHSALL
jgi:hypothetical protein